MTHDYDAAIAAVQKEWDDNIQAHGGAKVWGYTSNLANAVADVIINEAYPPADIDDIAEAYLEAFREVGTVIGIKAPSGTMFFATCNKGYNGRISNEAIEFHNALLNAAEEEGWDVEEMEGLK